jgi:hypothetical protein
MSAKAGAGEDQDVRLFEQPFRERECGHAGARDINEEAHGIPIARVAGVGKQHLVTGADEHLHGDEEPFLGTR